jgi:predicted nucleic acid-binding protein
VRLAQNHLLNAVAAGGIQVMDLLPEDYARIADLPGDFADLTLVALSERLNLAEILTLDSDFDVYRRFRREPFCRVPLS